MKSHSNGRDRASNAIKTTRNLVCAAALALSFTTAIPGAAFAQNGGGLPNTTIAPDDGSPSAAPPGAPAGNEETEPEQGGGEATPPSPAARPAHHHRRHVAKRHTSHHPESVAHSVVEPASAKLKLKEDAWAYSRPSKSSKTVERVRADKYLDVTGITRYYLQVRLKNGASAYVPIGAVDLSRPTDKIFKLNSDAAVVSEPSRYGHKLSEVHRGHDVHVVATSLNYLKIRMKSGLEGFIPMGAAE